MYAARHRGAPTSTGAPANGWIARPESAREVQNLNLPTSRNNVVRKQRRRRNYVRNQHTDRLPGQDDFTSRTGPHTNPAATSTHVPVPHHEIVQALVETLGFRHIRVMADEYAVSPDGMKMFGVLDLETEMHGCRYAIGLRNSHDRSMRQALICGYRVTVCTNMAFSGDFTLGTMSP